MNRQLLSDNRSVYLHKVIAGKIRKNPSLLDIPKSNLHRWRKKMKKLPVPYQEWEHILNTASPQQILHILEDPSEHATRLRSSSPFSGILTEKERKTILKKFLKQ